MWGSKIIRPPGRPRGTSGGMLIGFTKVSKVATDSEDGGKASRIEVKASTEIGWGALRCQYPLTYLEGWVVILLKEALRSEGLGLPPEVR